MAYPLMNGTAMSSDLSYVFVYANSVTNGFFGIGFCLAFFFIVLIGSASMQQRFSGGVRPEATFTVASWATLGLATIMITKNGILMMWQYFIFVGFALASTIWLVLKTQDQ